MLNIKDKAYSIVVFRLGKNIGKQGQKDQGMEK